MSVQIPLDLGASASYAAADFLVSDCNRAARELVANWRTWPNRAAAIWGAAGAGKTHLAEVWRTSASAATLDLEAFLAVDLARIETPARFVLDLGAETLPTAGETPLFHLLNIVRERAGALLIVSRSAPARWPAALPDLASRLRALPAAEVGQPDDALFAAVLNKHFADRQLAVDAETVDYLVLRSERSFAAAAALAARLDQEALARRRNITIPLARIVLADIENEASAGDA